VWWAVNILRNIPPKSILNHRTIKGKSALAKKRSLSDL